MNTSIATKPLRFLELVLVLGIAFGPALLITFYLLLGKTMIYEPELAGFRMIGALILKFSSLALLVYVLFRQGRGLRDIGLSFRWKDISWGITLALLGYGVETIVHVGIRYGYWSVSGENLKQVDTLKTVFYPHGITALGIAFELVNPFFEELMARAYLMAELNFLTGKAYIAVMGSTVFQAFYHFYQGATAVFSHGSEFLIWSIYFQRRKRIMPVVFAHFFVSVAAFCR